jgi:uncharacterized membrane protein YdfJ with MMPL/SSD domain
MGVVESATRAEGTSGSAIVIGGSAFARWGRRVSRQPWPWGVASVLVLLVLAIPLLSMNLGQPDNGTNPLNQSSRRAYDLISEGFGVGANGPLTVVVKLPKQSSSADQSLLSSIGGRPIRSRRTGRRADHGAWLTPR